MYNSFYLYLHVKVEDFKTFYKISKKLKGIKALKTPTLHIRKVTFFSWSFSKLEADQDNFNALIAVRYLCEN